MKSPMTGPTEHEPSPRTRKYFFQDRDDEDDRLDAQARILDPLTRRLFANAGIAPGMRVLDLGSGAGHVALLLAEFVGPTGSVVGVERDAEAIEFARRRISSSQYTNVEIHEGDVYALDGIDGPFDAVIGRMVLMYLPDPAAAIRTAVAKLAPGGIVCCQEPDLNYAWAMPETPLWSRIRTWFIETMDKAGVEQRMGLLLNSTFLAAGLPNPRLMLEAVLATDADSPVPRWVNSIRGALPLMERFGVATAADIELETLAERLSDELDSVGGVAISPPLVGAWTTTSAH